MSDHHAAPDPIDQAYVQAEALLDDDAARVARRERVLGAVAQAPVLAEAATPTRRSPLWRRGGWLAAACVAGLSVFIASQVYEPAPRQPQTTPAAPTAPAAANPTAANPTAANRVPGAPVSAVPNAANRGIVASPGPSTTAPGAPPARQDFADASGVAAPAPMASPPVIAPAAPPPPPVATIEPARRAFPAAPAPAPVVTAERAAQASAASDAATPSGDARDEVAQGGLARPDAKRASSAAFAAPPAAAMSRFKSSADLPSDPAARLRAAAAAGRTGEVAALLDQGAPVDAPDDEGDTALIQSVRADHPAAAAVLRRHGASLDHRNHAGQSAKDLAAAKGDAELDQAIGVGP